MKKNIRRLVLARETVRSLESGALRAAHGQFSGPCGTTDLTSCDFNSYRSHCFSQCVPDGCA
jgi:hypothetical protein